jgi:hypothetical protein
MTKLISSKGQWQPGQSGNPKGRKPNSRTLAEILRRKGDALVTLGNEQLSAQEALAEAVWQFVITGEVWLMGKKLQAQSVGEWASVVKWLYTYAEPPKARESEAEPEIVVRVLRETKAPVPRAAVDGEDEEEWI